MSVALRDCDAVLLDTLRSVSAYVVFLAHINQIFLYRLYGYGGLTAIPGQLATYAVMMFFILSGFLVTSSILRNRQEHAGAFSVRAYAQARLSRLYPPLLFSLLLCAGIYLTVTGLGLHGATSFRFPGDTGLYAVAREKVSFDPVDYVWTLVFMQSLFVPNIPALNGPLWSISWEFWYYVGAAFVALAAGGRRWLWISALVLLLVLIHHFERRALQLSSVWCFGAALALLYRRIVLQPNRGRVWMAAAIAVGLAAWALARRQPVQWDQPVVIVPLSLTAAALLALAMAHGLGAGAGRLVRAVAGGARHSYTLYVVHFPLLLFAQSLFGPLLRHERGAVFWLFLAVCALAIAAVAHGAARVLEDRNAWLAWIGRLAVPMKRRTGSLPGG